MVEEKLKEKQPTKMNSLTKLEDGKGIMTCFPNNKIIIQEYKINSTYYKRIVNYETKIGIYKARGRGQKLPSEN